MVRILSRALWLFIISTITMLLFSVFLPVFPGLKQPDVWQCMAMIVCVRVILPPPTQVMVYEEDEEDAA